MHPTSYATMATILGQIVSPDHLVLDVGSFDVNGTYRPIVEEKGWRYVGLDIVKGPNVDVVAEPYCYPFRDGTFDIVISGSTMEHVQAIWLWVPELARILKPGGALVIITHWSFHIHRHPVDCWRILPEGMEYLFDLCGNLERYQVGLINNTDIMGIARKARHVA